MFEKAFSKGLLLTIAASCLIAVPSVFPDSTYAAGEQTPIVLSQGTSGTAVTELQQSLQSLGYFTYPNATGYYGQFTVQAVRSFQQAYSLPMTGAADGTTRIALSRALVKKSILTDAKRYIGTPYVWGGSTPAGFDCSGFIYYLLSKQGVPMNRTSSSVMAGMGFAVDRDRLMPGDWVFFGLNEPGVVSHVGIYTGNGEFISATRSAGIAVQKLDSSYWGSKYLGARRYY
ncbi:hydrolase Nlp/P60 [Paenibacillus sp. A3]|uniref:C40 family peptidase n=1 Tax=Paenibacillus sp. A3 TaxID=1337054 RepID=UPI0006D561C9|nr:C40 family peptidase [Paenibacillus sp. A3]KPV57282.1 hydrolase Nlp/P60 [Paenibacillus sp. A3]